MGIISEMELHTMKIRLERGRLNKAQRGERTTGRKMLKNAGKSICRQNSGRYGL